MKWKTKRSKATESPKHGDKRMITSFALLPTACNNGNTVWLEEVGLQQTFVGCTCEDSDCDNCSWMTYRIEELPTGFNQYRTK